MNRHPEKRRGVALIIVLAFLVLAVAFAAAALVLFESQHRLTYATIALDEVRYANEMGLRHGLWVWRYKYEEFNLGGEPYVSDPLTYTGHNVKGVCVKVEDKFPADRRLDLGAEEIMVKVLRIKDPDSCSW